MVARFFGTSSTILHLGAAPARRVRRCAPCRPSIRGDRRPTGRTPGRPARPSGGTRRGSPGARARRHAAAARWDRNGCTIAARADHQHDNRQVRRARAGRGRRHLGELAHMRRHPVGRVVKVAASSKCSSSPSAARRPSQAAHRGGERRWCRRRRTKAVVAASQKSRSSSSAGSATPVSESSAPYCTSCRAPGAVRAACTRRAARLCASPGMRYGGARGARVDHCWRRWQGATLLGCSPTAYTLEPYRDQPALAAALSEQARQECVAQRGVDDLPPYYFTSDGCSWWPDSTWVDCCGADDMAYWCGGSAADRERADRALRECVVLNGPRAWARPCTSACAPAARRASGAVPLGLRLGLAARLRAVARPSLAAWRA